MRHLRGIYNAKERLIPFNVAKLTRRPPTSPTSHVRTSRLQRRRRECRVQTVAKSVAGVVESGLHGRFRAASFNASPSHSILSRSITSSRRSDSRSARASPSRAPCPMRRCRVSHIGSPTESRNFFVSSDRQRADSCAAAAARANLTPCQCTLHFSVFVIVCSCTFNLVQSEIPSTTQITPSPPRNGLE